MLQIGTDVGSVHAQSIVAIGTTDVVCLAKRFAQIAAHQEVLEEVKRKVHMMTAGRPLNRY